MPFEGIDGKTPKVLNGLTFWNFIPRNATFWCIFMRFWTKFKSVTVD